MLKAILIVSEEVVKKFGTVAPKNIPVTKDRVIVITITIAAGIWFAGKTIVIVQSFLLVRLIVAKGQTVIIYCTKYDDASPLLQ